MVTSIYFTLLVYFCCFLICLEIGQIFTIYWIEGKTFLFANQNLVRAGYSYFLLLTDKIER